MKKTLITGAIASIAIIGAGTFFYLDEKKAQQNTEKATAVQTKQESKEQTQTVDLSKNDGYCLIRYQISTDSGKTWEEVVVKNGLDPINTQDCWSEYGDLLKKFDKDPDADGHLHGTEDGNPITSPSMAFSSKPISLEDAHKKDEERKAAAEQKNNESDENTTDKANTTDNQATVDNTADNQQKETSAVEESDSQTTDTAVANDDTQTPKADNTTTDDSDAGESKADEM